MHVTGRNTVGEIVAWDFRSAAVFHDFGIDFCCGGKRLLDDVCRERQLDTGEVLEAVSRACSATQSTPRFDEWSPETLIAFIVDQHHGYVRRTLPALTANTQKLATAHGARHPELPEVARLTQAVAAEMLSHMAKEECVLFPYIADVSAAVRAKQPVPLGPFGSIENPIRMMEHEHESAGAAMARIRDLTSGYQVPADGCTTYRVALQQLAEFERDLHAHVHLENNILFPRAKALAGAVPV
jgi:regulator of cell morphogenesis and NO signaling